MTPSRWLVGSFAAGVTDTTITRYLKSPAPVDSVTDSLVVIAIAVGIVLCIKALT